MLGSSHNHPLMDAPDLRDFYEDAYSVGAPEAAEGSRWRALSARGKADHVIALCRRGHVSPRSTLEVGCGDGAILSELAARGFGGTLAGAELSAAAVEIASSRAEIDEVRLFDGERLPFADGAFDLGILSHVLEHVPHPHELLAETARCCAAVVVEVPLEANISARRASKREHADEVGHIQRLDRDAVAAIAARAGLAVAAELEDPLPRQAHVFWAREPRARAAGTVKWALREAVHRASPALARRSFTLHYACLCIPRAG